MEQIGHCNLAYQQAFEASLDAIVCSDEKGLITLWNPAAERIFGYGAKEALGQPLAMLMPASEQKKHHTGFRRFISTGRPRISGKTVEVNGLGKDGLIFPVELSLSSRKTAHGWNFTAVLRDISERKQAEERLRIISRLSARATGQDFFRALVSSVAKGLGVKVAFAAEFISNESASARSLAIWVGEELAEDMQWTLSGTPCEEVAKGEFVFFADSVQQAFPDDLWLAEAGLESYMGVPMLDDEGHTIGHIGIMDSEPMSEDRKIENMMRIFANRAAIELERKRANESLRKLSQAIEQAGESILITDSQGVIEYVNSAFTSITGYTMDEAIGQTPRMLKSGNQDAVFYQSMWNTITRGKVWHGKVIDRKKDGAFYPAMLTISPIFDGSGKASHYCSHYVGIQTDLTELEDLEKQFHQAQKMDAVGTLVGGIAHDFNNILAGITCNLYLAKKQVQENPDVVRKLVSVEALSMRAADMIQQLLTFARKGQVSMKPLPLSPFIKETLKFLRTAVPENINLQQDICSDSLQIKGDGTQIHQLLMNLVNNARDALEGVKNPCITIRLEAFCADETFIKRRTYFTAGLYAHLSVQDNGIGIPKHQIEHLFEPFFTTKEQGKGTGLGLAMVFGAIKTHHGFVEVDSIEDEGSTFHIYIPLLEKEGVASTSTQEGEVVKGHGETILLVDDQSHIIETGKEVLESLGYVVLTATDGRQAVEIFEAHAEEIDLCILDVVMPVLSGVKVAQSIRQINPKIKIIFSTGYDKNLQSDLEHETVLNKPFSIIEMSHLIRQKLDS